MCVHVCGWASGCAAASQPVVKHVCTPPVAARPGSQARGAQATTTTRSYDASSPPPWTGLCLPSAPCSALPFLLSPGSLLSWVAWHGCCMPPRCLPASRGRHGCRSTTKGTTVFRVLRDDTYIALMLRVLSRFHTQHVLRGVPPPRDMFKNLGERERGHGHGRAKPQPLPARHVLMGGCIPLPPRACMSRHMHGHMHVGICMGICIHAWLGVDMDLCWLRTATRCQAASVPARHAVLRRRASLLAGSHSAPRPARRARGDSAGCFRGLGRSRSPQHGRQREHLGGCACKQGKQGRWCGSGGGVCHLLS